MIAALIALSVSIVALSIAVRRLRREVASLQVQLRASNAAGRFLGRKVEHMDARARLRRAFP